MNERGERVVHTYAQLLHQVKRISAALRGLGIGKGDRITIYMPPCPESIALMLATVRIGAIHSIVFAGFGAQALGDRIAASGSRVVFATDVIYRKGQRVPLLPIVDAAVKVAAESVERVVVFERDPASPRGSHASWTEFLRHGEGHDSGHTEMESNEPAFILATSGTTAKPKLAIHTHGGYQVHVVSDGQVVVRPQADGCVVGDVGYRLDRRPQLHGVRAAARRLHDDRVRRRARLSRTPMPTGARRSRSSASPASSRRRPRFAC